MTAGEATVAAIDLGASSGRVMLGHVGPATLELVDVNRFANLPVRIHGVLQWDIVGLYRGVLDGLRAAGHRAGQLDGVGIDSWAVDYGLLDAGGSLLGATVHYRDGRTDGTMARALEQVPAEVVYGSTGIQFLPFNTLYQLLADDRLPAASSILLIPDLLSYWLTGVAGTELTNASTTQLLDPRTQDWASGWPARLGLDTGLFAPLRRPGDPAGELEAGTLADTGLTGPVPVVAVGSHDTASAVVGVPAEGKRFAYISCGTWSLVGVELDGPVLTEAGRAANFTNEIGVDGTVRYLRNVMGLWLLQESMRSWAAAGLPADLESLLFAAARIPALTAVVDVDDESFLTPGDMPARIAAYCRRTDQAPPHSQAQTVRCILDSLALAYRSAVADAQRLSGRAVDVVHVVGGGARNGLLCQLTADACGLPVVAGPAEAAALGNVLVQARTLGAVGGGLAEMRALLRGTQVLVRYEPAATTVAWDSGLRRLARP